MPDPGFERLRQGLLAGGISKTYIDRLTAELREHYLDLEADRRAAGETPIQAATAARRTLGNDAAIVLQVLTRPELRRPDHWVERLAGWVHVEADLLGPVTAPAIARWSASISLGAVLTVGLLFALARAIAIGV
jgi:hypothetical protein